MSDAYIFDAIRTPRAIGKPGGGLYSIKPFELLATLFRSLREKHELDTSLVDDVLIGCVTAINDQGFNIARASLLQAGWDDSASGVQLNRYCASGLEAINLAAMKVRSGWESLLVAGGTESMSRIPIGSDGGALMYDPELVSKTGHLPQGVAADLIASKEGFQREAVDGYALRSHQLAEQARAAGYGQASIIPIYDRNGVSILDQDENIRPETTADTLAELSPAFQALGQNGFDAIALRQYPEIEKIHHVHTAGNSCALADGAAIVLVGSEAMGQQLGLKARARIRAISSVSVEPTIMLTGAVPAAQKALKRAGMTVDDIDLWECNEAFASVVLYFQKHLNIPLEKINVNGGAIALGHPLGATGAMLLGNLLDELERRDLKIGLVAISVGGGMGVATIIERV